MASWHFITSEYPPQSGGVSDCTLALASALADGGDVAHVWCPAVAGTRVPAAGVIVHPDMGSFTSTDLAAVGAKLDRLEQPRRLIVQWVPHGYGYKAMNVGFCWWLLRRAAAGDRIEVVIHEPFLPFSLGSIGQSAAAVVQRLMMVAVLGAARKVWVSTPSWIPRIRPYALGRKLQATWLPTGTSVAVAPGDEPAAIRERYSLEGRRLVGHFGTYERQVASRLDAIVSTLVTRSGNVDVLLMGRGSERHRDAFLAGRPELTSRIYATGFLDAVALSRHLAACDVMVQPFPDGVSFRRTSVVSALAHGLPVVTTAGELTEPLWAESGAVVLVGVDDHEAAAHAIETVLLDDPARRRLALRASAVYESTFATRHAAAVLRCA